LFSYSQLDPYPVGYNDSVDASIYIETFALLMYSNGTPTPYMNYTTDNWSTFHVVSLHDTFISSGRYHGTIPAQPIYTFVRYYYNATSYNGTHYFTSVSDEYNYTVIDTYPPDIIHDNSSTNSFIGVSNPHPYPSVTSLTMNVRANDEVTDVGQGDVKLHYDINGSFAVSNMTRNGTSDHFYHTINYNPSTVLSTNGGYIKYFIEARDKNSTPNIAYSGNYTIRIDDQHPSVSDIYIDPNRKVLPTDPDTTEYSDLVDVYCNITDDNALGSLYLVWSATSFATNSSHVALTHVSGNRYKTATKIPKQNYGTTIHYAIHVEDSYGNAQEVVGSYYVSDFTAPDILSIAQEPLAVGIDTPVTVTVNVYESSLGSGIAAVYLQYRYTNSSGHYSDVLTVLMDSVNGNTYSGIIEGLPLGTHVQYLTIVIDSAGNADISDLYEYDVIDIGTYTDWAVFLLYVIIGATPLAGPIVAETVYSSKSLSGAAGKKTKMQKMIRYAGWGILAAIPIGIGMLMGLGITPIKLSGLSLSEFLAEPVLATQFSGMISIMIIIAIALTSVGIALLLKNVKKNASTKRIVLKPFKRSTRHGR